MGDPHKAGRAPQGWWAARVPHSMRGMVGVSQNEGPHKPGDARGWRAVVAEGAQVLLTGSSLPACPPSCIQQGSRDLLVPPEDPQRFRDCHSHPGHCSPISPTLRECLSFAPCGSFWGSALWAGEDSKDEAALALGFLLWLVSCSCELFAKVEVCVILFSQLFSPHEVPSCSRNIRVFTKNFTCLVIIT